MTKLHSVLASILLAVDFHLLELVGASTLNLTGLDGFDQILESQHGSHGDTEFILCDLHGAARLGVTDTFLPGQEKDDTHDDAALCLDDGDGFAESGAGRHDIVDHDDAFALERRADDGPTLAMVLCFLAVEGVRDPREVLPAEFQLPDHNRTQRDALVRGTEDDVEMGRKRPIRLGACLLRAQRE